MQLHPLEHERVQMEWDLRICYTKRGSRATGKESEEGANSHFAISTRFACAGYHSTHQCETFVDCPVLESQARIMLVAYLCQEVFHFSGFHIQLAVWIVKNLSACINNNLVCIISVCVCISICHLAQVHSTYQLRWYISGPFTSEMSDIVNVVIAKAAAAYHCVGCLVSVYVGLVNCTHANPGTSNWGKSPATNVWCKTQTQTHYTEGLYFHSSVARTNMPVFCYFQPLVEPLCCLIREEANDAKVSAYHFCMNGIVS